MKFINILGEFILVFLRFISAYFRKRKLRKALKFVGSREPSKEDLKYHISNISMIRNDFRICQLGFERGYISKSQLKKSLTDSYNREKKYIAENGLVISGDMIIAIKNKEI